MDVNVLKELKEKAEQLSPEKNVDLIVHLLNKVRTARMGSGSRSKWSEICGKALCPLTGEDAQVWVTRARKESDERREKQWR